MQREDTPLWAADPDTRSSSNLYRFTTRLNEHTGAGLDPDDYMALHQWSVENIGEFWTQLAGFYGIAMDGSALALSEDRMPGARWFEGNRISYAEHVFRDRPDDGIALASKAEDLPLVEWTWYELRAATARFREFLIEQGVGRGDRVAGYLHNGPEAVVAFLATASLGAIWASCSPDFGPAAAADRLGQISPSVLVAVTGYQYGGKSFDRRETILEMAEDISGLKALVSVAPPQSPEDTGLEGDSITWYEIQAGPAGELEFERVPFDHPLWVLFSSGTTGLPKGLVHSHGGIVLEHQKWIGLQCNLGPGDRLFWMTTTGWTMWNFVVGGLLLGCTIVLYDGSLAYPGLEGLWDLAEEADVNCFGAGAGFYSACRKEGITPRNESRRLTNLRSVGSTGSPLQPEDYDWIHDELEGVWLFSTSGGTDICTAFVGGSILMPVRRGEIQAPALAVDVQAWDENGDQVENGEVGELVVTRPMPSMPVHLWNDESGDRYLDSYFDRYPGIWRHGDWIEFRDTGGSVIHGRSDSTINRGGVRIGTAEIYRAVLDDPAVEDALVVDVPREGGNSEVLLFVKTSDGELAGDSAREIASRIRRSCSPRHVPDRILPVPAVPRTLSGKVVETPIRKILVGADPEKVVSTDSLADPGAIDWFVRFRESDGIG